MEWGKVERYITKVEFSMEHQWKRNAWKFSSLLFVHVCMCACGFSYNVFFISQQLFFCAEELLSNTPREWDDWMECIDEFFFFPFVADFFQWKWEKGEKWRDRDLVKKKKICSIFRLGFRLNFTCFFFFGVRWLMDWLITWRSGAVLGCARSHADNHGFILDNNDVDTAGDVFSYFALSSRSLNNLPLILLWLCCWLVLLWAPEINASATITTNLGPGRILTGS